MAYCSSVYKSVVIVTIWLTHFAIKVVSGSYGDRSYKFQQCLKQCMSANCTDLVRFQARQPVYESLLQWSCNDECKYHCMWITVDAFQKDHLAVPQFYGKWPFIRLFGIQEPASVIFSVLNGLAHFRIFQYRKLVPESTPMYYVWHFFALIGVNAWFWSVVFHTKDTVFTEMMDYFCAFSLVMSTFFAFLCRVIGTDKPQKVFLFGMVLLTFYIQHVYYLAYVKFDYGYNMMVNVSVGIVNFLGWLIWCIYNRKQQPYVWKCLVFILGINILVGLELGDFPPLFWILDAHSLWHAGTAPLGFLWYSFVIEDGQYLAKSKEDIKKEQ